MSLKTVFVVLCNLIKLCSLFDDDFQLLSHAGIAPSCQIHVWSGKKDNYTYIIDPDGPPKPTGDPSKFGCILSLTAMTGIMPR